MERPSACITIQIGNLTSACPLQEKTRLGRGTGIQMPQIPLPGSFTDADIFDFTSLRYILLACRDSAIRQWRDNGRIQVAGNEQIKG